MGFSCVSVMLFGYVDSFTTFESSFTFYIECALGNYDPNVFIICRPIKNEAQC